MTDLSGIAAGPAAAAPILAVAGLQAWYGESHILHGVDFDVRPGEVVTLLGRNGAGKTTTLKSIMGIVVKRKGSAMFSGRETVGLSSDRIARLGVAICPEERGIFSSLNVRENLMLPPKIAKEGGLTLERIFALFPNLAERLNSGGGKLSGGEQRRRGGAGEFNHGRPPDTPASPRRFRTRFCNLPPRGRARASAP